MVRGQCEERLKNSEAKHLSRVAALGCALCRRMGYGESPAEIHHPRIGNTGMATKRSHFLGVPLCPSHHRGQHGIHGDRADFKNAGVDELDLLGDVLQELYG